MDRKCGSCGEVTGTCPECNKDFPHGTASHCDNEECMVVNSPIDCVGCQYVVSAARDGVLNFEMRLIPWKK